MNPENKIDKLFKTGIEGQRKDPPDYLWKSISGSLKEPPRAKNGGQKPGTRLFWWIALGLLPLLLVLVWWMNSGRNNKGNIPIAPPRAAFEQPDVPSAGRPVDDETNSPSLLTVNRPSKVASSLGTFQDDAPNNYSRRKENNLTPKEKAIPVQSYDNITTPQSAALSDLEEKNPGTDTYVRAKVQQAQDEIQNGVVRVETHTGSINKPKMAVVPELEPGNLDTGSNAITSDAGIMEKQAFGQRLKSYWGPTLWGMSFYAGPQLYRTISPYAPSVRSGFYEGVYGRGQFRNLWFSTGFGLTHFTETNRWKATMIRIDTVASYNYIQSLNFQPVYNPVDSSIMGYVPANIVTVYYPVIDSVKYELIKQVKNRYHYLHIPVMAGYDVIHYRNFTLGLSGGLIYNVRIYKDRPLPDLPSEEILFALHDQGLTRRDSYWQYQLGLNMQYDLGTKWYAEGSAAYRRSFNSWYAGMDTGGKPGIYLINAGIGFWF